MFSLRKFSCISCSYHAVLSREKSAPSETSGYIMIRELPENIDISYKAYYFTFKDSSYKLN